MVDSLNDLHSTEHEDDRIVLRYAQMAAGTAMQPLSALKNLGLMKLHLQLLVELADFHNVQFAELTGKALILAMIGNLRLGQFSHLHKRSLWASLPGLSLLGESIRYPENPVAITYAVGRVFQHHFRQGLALTDFDTSVAQKRFSAAYDEARFMVN